MIGRRSSVAFGFGASLGHWLFRAFVRFLGAFVIFVVVLVLIGIGATHPRDPDAKCGRNDPLSDTSICAAYLKDHP